MQDQSQSSVQMEKAEADKNEKMVPVVEAIKYRKRAQLAEKQVQDLSNSVKELNEQLDQVNETVVYLERRQKIDSLLTDANAIDLDTARLLTEASVSLMESEDVELAIEDLKNAKPFLFAQHKATASFMPLHQDINELDSADKAAAKAMQTGNKLDLLKYLRLKRKSV